MGTAEEMAEAAQLHIDHQRHLKKLALERAALLKQKAQSEAVTTAVIGMAVAALVRTSK
jgi:hypothetical protein